MAIGAILRELQTIVPGSERTPPQQLQRALEIRENQNALTGLVGIESMRRGMKEEDAAIALDNHGNEVGLWGDKEAKRPEDDEDDEDCAMGGLVGGDSLKDVTINIGMDKPSQVIATDSTPTAAPDETTAPAMKIIDPPTTRPRMGTLAKLGIIAALMGSGAGLPIIYNALNSPPPATDNIGQLEATVTD